MGTSKKFASYGITIDGDDQYELAVELSLHRIESSYTGKVLLSAIRNISKMIRIIPFIPTANDKCNAYGDATDLVAATPSHRYALSGSGDPIPRPESERFGLTPVDFFMGTGTGTGSDVTVSFTSSTWWFGVKGDCLQFVGAPGANPSLILFHELAHAYREARGTFYPRRTIGTNSRYNTMEEFFAVVLSNVLATDPTFDTANRTLRADHAGFTPLAANLSTSTGFVADTENRKLMRELAKSEPCLFDRLRDSKSTFNPFAEFLDEAASVTTVVVNPGDSLCTLAAKYYGTDEYWPLLWDANRDLVGSNPNRIDTRKPLSVPPLSFFTQAQLDDARRRFPTWRNY